ncbi:DUF4097 family beta strand repeat protein, partial [bacterium]|nr:DUF4097 family beta strand repeat protein [bacterium]
MRRILILAPAACVLLLAPALAGEFERQFQTDARALVLRNLIGQVRVTETGGDRYEIHVHVRGDDASEDLIRVSLDEGREAELLVEFPVDEHRDYVYPELGRRSKTTIYQPDGDQDRSWLSRLWNSLGGEKVTIRGSGKGLEVWADVELRVPSGRETEVYLGAGGIASEGVDGDLVLDTHSGGVSVDGHRGELVCDTGSGGVSIADVDGPVLADTGSGSVKVTGQRGGPLKVDTGSGSVSIDGADTPDLFVDTGSGGVRCRAIETDTARIDTGSGSVALHLDRMGTGRFVIDTGSGGVELTLPRDASATISVDTGSGGISSEFEGAEILHEDRGEMKLRVGGGAATVVIDTGSGGVK